MSSLMVGPDEDLWFMCSDSVRSIAMVHEFEYSWSSEAEKMWKRSTQRSSVKWSTRPTRSFSCTMIWFFWFSFLFRCKTTRIPKFLREKKPQEMCVTNVSTDNFVSKTGFLFSWLDVVWENREYLFYIHRAISPMLLVVTGILLHLCRLDDKMIRKDRCIERSRL